MRPQMCASIFICLLDQAYGAPCAHIKMEHRRWPEMPLILGRSGTQYVAMAKRLLLSYCGAHVIDSYCKESKISGTNWLRYLFLSYLIKIRLSVWDHHWAYWHILKTCLSLERKEIFMRDDVVSQHLKFGSAFLWFSWESKIVLFF